MPSTALNRLQDEIEAIRREAFAEGYAAAMQSVREFASRPGANGGTAPVPAVPDMRAGIVRAGGARAADGRASGARAGGGRTGREPRQAKPVPAAPRPRRARQAAPTPPPRRPRRPQRGTNARLVEEILQAIAPRAARPTEIRDALKRDRGVTMAFTSIRHALGQLEARRAVQQVPDSKTWRTIGAGDAAAGS